MPVYISDDLSLTMPPTGQIRPEDPAEISAPADLEAADAAAMSAPIVVTSILGPALAAPATKASIARAPMAAPTARTAQAQPGMAAPVSLNNVARAPMAAPATKASVARAPMAAPATKASIARAPMAAPATLTSQPNDAEAPPFPLNHARILYYNALIGATASATSGTTPAAVLTPATYSRWTFTGTQTITFVLPIAANIDSVGIAAHALGGASVLVQYRTSDAGSWATFGLSSPTTNDGALLYLTSVAVSVKQLRIAITGTGARVIGVVYAGIALQMQRPIWRGHRPTNLNRATEYTNNKSEGGNWLGRDIIRQGVRADAAWRNLTPTWYRQYFDPFVVSATKTPFFFSWNPNDYPQDCAYLWTTEDFKPDNAGPRDLMAVSMAAEGHS